MLLRRASLICALTIGACDGGYQQPNENTPRASTVPGQEPGRASPPEPSDPALCSSRDSPEVGWMKLGLSLQQLLQSAAPIESGLPIWLRVSGTSAGICVAERWRDLGYPTAWSAFSSVFGPAKKEHILELATLAVVTAVMLYDPNTTNNPPPP
jgi:hypothetical protein